MKPKKVHKKLWVAVKVERGMIRKAKVYKSFDSARTMVHRWQSRLNPDYDEAAVIEAT
jgi:hypothetical protein